MTKPPSAFNHRGNRGNNNSENEYGDDDGITEETVNHSAYLDEMEEGELLVLRGEIDELLSATALQHLNLEQELVVTYLNTRSLMNKTTADVRVPANQKSQIISTCKSLLDSLVKTQVEIYTSERLKRMEHSLVESIQSLPTETQDKFFELYEEVYGNIRETYEQKKRKETK